MEIKWYPCDLGDLSWVALYIMSDLHYGNPYSDIKRWNHNLEYIAQQPNSFIILNGDLCESSLRTSKGDIYKQVGSPQDQRDQLIEWLRPVRGKVLGMTTGNHEQRIWKEVGIDISEDIAKGAGVVNYDPEGIWLNLKFSTGANRVTNRPYSYWVYACFDEDTEILTKRGWKHRAELLVGEPALTYNLDSGDLEYQPLQQIYEYTTINEMYHFVGRSVDCRVSSGHTLVYQFDTDLGWRRASAEHVSKFTNHNTIVPRAGRYHGAGVDISDDWLRLIAWVVTEGHFREQSTAIELRQNANSPHVYEMISILGRLGIAYTLHVEATKGKEFTDERVGKTYRYADDHAKICIPAADGRTIRAIVPEKRIPDVLREMSHEQAEMFLGEMMKGDGYTRHSKHYKQQTYITKDYVLAGQVQEIAIKHGHASNIRKHGNCWAVSLSERDRSAFDPKNVTIEPYVGVAWCASVGNETLVARRNGKVMITGNTHGYGGARTKGGKAVKAERLATHIRSDIYGMSHDHEVNVAPLVRLDPNAKVYEKDGKRYGYAQAHRMELVKTNAYLRWGGYARSGGFSPPDLDTPAILMRGEDIPWVGPHYNSASCKPEVKVQS